MIGVAIFDALAGGALPQIRPDLELGQIGSLTLSFGPVTAWYASEWLLLVASLPITAIILGLTGTTLGKWLMGIRVLRRDGRPIGIPKALGRELLVLAVGTGFALPLANLCAYAVACRNLVEDDITAWDQWLDLAVTQRPNNWRQWCLSGLVGGLVAFVVLAAAYAVSAAGHG
jgi:uncharacterized RDD family membrane protein YckC